MGTLKPLDERDADRYVGRKIREQRKAVGMSQADLASCAGFTRSSVANIEAGRQGLPAIRLAVVAAALGADIASLIPPVTAPALPPPPHKVTVIVRTVYEVVCETCSGAVIGTEDSRPAAAAARREHIDHWRRREP